MSGLIYPCVVHWAWSNHAAFAAPEGALGVGAPFVDFAGSGVVHMVGGVAGGVGAVLLGPRHGRFASDGAPVPIKPHNLVLSTMGTVLLWFGWYGFNGFS